MKKINAGFLLKIGSILLIATLLIGAITLAADGWNSRTSADSDENVPPAEAGNATGVAAIDRGAEQVSGAPEEATTDAPYYENRLTGLVCSEKAANALSYCFVTDPSAPLYGAYSADLTVEIPTEDGKTRLLMFESDPASLGKIGALAPTRGYIESVCRFFGGVSVSYGRDDIVNYPTAGGYGAIDLSSTGYCYMENIRYPFTSGENVSLCAESLGFAAPADAEGSPFSFTDDAPGEYFARGGVTSLTIPYAAETTLVYSPSEQRYVLEKDGKVKTDLLTGRSCGYRNVLVLFADTVSYGKASGTETVIDTLSGGSGYCMTDGIVTEFRWSVSENGELLFRTLSGTVLQIGRGKTYIGYYPSYASYDLRFES